MKKILFSIAILASSAVAFAQSPTFPSTQSATQVEQTACCKKDGKPAGKMERKKSGECRAFEGITLTDDQKTKLNALRESKRGGKAVKGTSDKSRKSDLTPEQRKQMMAERKAGRLEARKSYLDGVKQILTPEQYVKFLENNFTITQHKDKKNGKGLNRHKGGRKGRGDMKSAARPAGKPASKKS